MQVKIVKKEREREGGGRGRERGHWQSRLSVHITCYRLNTMSLNARMAVSWLHKFWEPEFNIFTTITAAVTTLYCTCAKQKVPNSSPKFCALSTEPVSYHSSGACVISGG